MIDRSSNWSFNAEQCQVQLKTTLNSASARHFCRHQRVLSFQAISFKSKQWQSSTTEGASTDAKRSIGYTKMHQSKNFKVAVSQSWLLYLTKSLQKELGFFLQNCGTAQFLKFGLFLHCKNELKRAQNVQNSEFAYYASKSGKWIKQTPTPPFWGGVGE